MTTNFMHMKRNKVEMVSDYRSTCQHKLFPTIDQSYLTNDGYHEDVSFLDIDYQEADYGSELDLAAPNCDKSAQHNDFKNIDEFSVEHLPEKIRHPSIVFWVRYAAQLVVRLSRKVNASGRVFVISDHLKNEYPCKNVRCPYNHLLGNDHVVRGGLGIITNKHVVKTDMEAKDTKVEFFYHNDDRRDMVIKENGRVVHFTDHNLDYTMFTCAFHQPELVSHIEMCTSISNFAWQCIPETIKTTLRNFAIVISHPHGSSKKVSIGNVIGYERKTPSKEANQTSLALRDLYKMCERSDRALKRFAVYISLIKDLRLTVRVYYYDAATCPGSSGAPVYMGHTAMGDSDDFITPHTHRGRHPINGYNNCYT